MGRGSSWRQPGSGRDDLSTRHRPRGASYKPVYAQAPPTHPRHGEGSWKPDGPQPHALGPHKKRNRRNKAPADSDRISVNSLKSKIRDITRALKSDRMPADVRIEQERALAGYKQDLEHGLQHKEKRELTKRYHMVRFFERQKATRQVKKTQKGLADCQPGTLEYENLQETLHIAQVDLNYALYYPLNQKYESLFADGYRKEPRSAMWKVVEKCMEDGTLGALRNGIMDMTLSFGRTKPFTKGSVGLTSYHKEQSSVVPKSEEIDEDSDGGFFEKDGSVKI